MAGGRESDRDTAWVSLDAADNDPGRLWTHIATALDRIGCDLGVAAVERFVSTNINNLRDRVLPRIVTALAAVSDDVFILLDNFHFVSDAECHSQVEFLIENLPPRAHLVIITRADPGLRLGRLRASGSLAEIRAHDLSFDDVETAQMMAMHQVPLSSEGITRLIESTEGWPAGIYLARLWLAGKAEPDEVVRRFSGGNRFIGDYLTEEVLSQHTPETRDFIVTMSFLDRFSAPLCNFVRQTTDAAAILHELERSNLFLIPLDENAPLVPLPPPVRRRREWRAGGRSFRAGSGAARPSSAVVPRARPHRRRRSALHRRRRPGGRISTRPGPLAVVRRRRAGVDRSGVARCPGGLADGQGSGGGRRGGLGSRTLRRPNRADAPPDGARRVRGPRAPSGRHPVGGVRDRDDPGGLRLRRAWRDAGRSAPRGAAGDRCPLAVLRSGDLRPWPCRVRLGRPRRCREPAEQLGVQRGGARPSSRS